MTTLKLGVAGAGVFGSYHAAKIDAREDLHLAGVYDTEHSRADALASKFSTTPYDDFSAFIADLDGVVIAAPATTHFELGEAALIAGKHVFIEKPVATNTSAARALVDIAAEKSLVLQAGHQERYVCEAIGLFSRSRMPQRIECIRHVPFTGRCGDVSAVLDLMVHDIDVIRHITGAELLNVSADGDSEKVAAELFLSTGTLAILSARRAASASERRMTIVYDDGAIDFDFIRRTLSNTTESPISSVFDAGAAPLAVRDPLAYGAELFANGIRRGKTLGVSGEDAANTVEWARKIEQAAGIDAVRDVDLRQRVRK